MKLYISASDVVESAITEDAQPTTINPEDIKATYKDGILTVEVPKQEEKKPKQITIDVK